MMQTIQISKWLVPSAVVFLVVIVGLGRVGGQTAGSFCPPQELITPCRCYQRGGDIQVWCSHSDLPRVLSGLKAIAKNIRTPIDELILENNQLPSLPARFFSALKIVRLMLRHNGIERVSNGWLNGLEDHLMEVYVVERGLRNVPVDSLSGLQKLEAVTVESESLKRVPKFARMPRLKYVRIESSSLIELLPGAFRDLPALETVYVSGSVHLNRLEAGVFENLPRLAMLNLKHNGINYLHGKALTRLPALKALDLSDNEISDARMVGRAIRELNHLEMITLASNHITSLATESFAELPLLQELQLQKNSIAEIQYGAFFNTPRLRLVHLEDNFIQRIHPDAFLQFAGQNVEYFHVQNNEISRTEELRSILDALPRLKFLDVSGNRLDAIAFGAVRNHEALEQLYLDHNRIQHIEREAFVVMPGLRELRLKNNSLSNALDFPIWNLPGLKGLDLSANQFSRVDPLLLVGLPSLRHLDLSENRINTINSASFDNTPYLETINISYNKISTIHQATFHKLDKLFELDASHNELREFVPGLPKIVERISLSNNRIANLPLAANKALNLPNLKMLNLDHNELYRIPRMSMQYLSKMRYLGLAENRLQTIDEFSLTGLKELEQLNLQDNKIMALHEKSMESLKVLRILNLNGNRLELMVDRILGSLEQLRHLDVSQNHIIEMTPLVFGESRLLEYIDLSNNNLKDLPISLTGMTELKILDISNNQLTNISVDMFSSFTKLEELRVANNKVRALTKGALRSLPHLEYLDLSSNELALIEPNAIRNLPQLKELVLADNMLTEMGDRVCEDLPNLQAVHLQHNKLQYISPTTFYRSPSIVYLNVSLNSFDNLQNIGINSIRNVEVLDVSGNDIRRLSTSDLHGLDWLVELKLDDNKICRVQGEPFNAMPRLRVLTMRNNRIANIGESSFRSVRGNLGVFDLDGNPLRCSCEMLWLRAWYQETNSLTRFPGPRCNDGSMLRDMRVSQADCAAELSGLRGQQQQQVNAIPQLVNEHGDSYGQAGLDFGSSECDQLVQVEEHAGNGVAPAFPGDSKYFNDRYIDYISNNESSKEVEANPFAERNNSKLDALLNLNQTLLDYNKHKLEQQYLQHMNSPANSKFTFFGMPLPNLNMGNLWNFGRDAKTRSMQGTRGTPRLQVYRPDEIDFYTFLNRHPANDTARAKIMGPTSLGGHRSGHSVHSNDPGAIEAPELYTPPFYRPPFRTQFAEPVDVERGGFRPILPEMTGNFRPMNSPNNGTQQEVSAAVEVLDEESLSHANSDRIKIVSGSYQSVEAGPDDETFVKNIKPVEQATVRYEVVTESATETQLQGVQHTTIFKRPFRPPTTTTTTNAPTAIHQFDRNEELSVANADSSEPMASSTTERPVTSTLVTLTIEQQSITQSPATTTTATSTTGFHQKPLDTYDPWTNLNHASSSLSALVAPGAQLSNYRSPPGRSTIVKVSTPSPQSTPKAAEYHQTTPRTLFTAPPPETANSYTSSPLGMGLPAPVNVSAGAIGRRQSLGAQQLNSAGRKSNMTWYYANYNRTTDDIQFESSRRNRVTSGTAISGACVSLVVASVFSYLVKAFIRL